MPNVAREMVQHIWQVEYEPPENVDAHTHAEVAAEVATEVAKRATRAAEAFEVAAARRDAKAAK